MQDQDIVKLKEEARYQYEKIKTISFENNQLKAQKEEMTKKMNEMQPRYVSDSMDTVSQKSKGIYLIKFIVFFQREFICFLIF